VRPEGAGSPARRGVRGPAGARRAPASLLFLAAAFCLSAGVAHAAAPTPQQEVEGQLMCYCGCSDLTVRVCTCGTADSIREDIAQHLAGGETPDQVVAAYVARYGSQIRSAPTKSGFDLVAWVTPFFVLVLAASALVVVVRRWGGTRAPEGALPAGGPDRDDGAPRAQDSRALERVRRELREGR